ncbi:MAG: hypothetical protein HPY85_06785 [Anaerolineae bacterium]|nr:hypothetical protein [Anaerolineae bacterium]
MCEANGNKKSAVPVGAAEMWYMTLVEITGDLQNAAAMGLTFDEDLDRLAAVLAEMRNTLDDQGKGVDDGGL